MYLSRVKLNYDLRNTKRALANLEIMHAIVMGCFDGSVNQQRPLWRVDRLAGRFYLLLVSAERPDFTSLLPQITSNTADAAEIKDYDPFLVSVTVGIKYRFRLCANPTHSVSQGSASNKRGKVYGHVSVDQQKEWLEKRAMKHGFEPLSFEVTGRSLQKFKRQGRTVTLALASFEGLLKVSDPDLLRETLSYGLGRAKAYGCGLMTIAGL